MNKYYPTEDPFLNAARGLIKGGEVVNIFGASPNDASIVTGEFRTAWEFASDYEFPPSALAMNVTSDIGTTADDGVQVLIRGLNADYFEIQEVATVTNGTPYVTQPFLRINDVITVSGNATGNISVTNTGIVYGYILTHLQQIQMVVKPLFFETLLIITQMV
jgi:hypothetical protein